MKLFLVATVGALTVVGCSGGDQSGATAAKAPVPTATSTVPPPAGEPAAGKYVAVQAIFTQNCVRCHSGPRPKAGLDLSSYGALMKGGRGGPVIKAGDAVNSRLIMALHGKGAPQMPPKGTLSADNISAIEGWVKTGAKNG